MYLIPIMIFMHIVDDYYLQGILASMKQKSWWQKQETYCDKYKHDYKVALFMHAFSWTFMIMLPLFLVYGFQYNIFVGLVAGLNCFVHLTVDDLKANKKKINLWQDQLIHIVQIIITALVVPFLYSL